MNVANEQVRVGFRVHVHSDGMADPAALVITAMAGALGGAGLVAVLARARTARLHDELDRAATSLHEREQAAAEADTVRDVIDAAMEDGVLLFDASRRLVYTNEAGVRHLGRRPTTIAQLYPTAAAEAAAASAEERVPRIVEVETAAPARWLRIAATPAGSEGGVLVVVSDVTAARRVETVRRDFVINASHELKTPAASIQAAAETLLDAVEHDPEAVPRFAAMVQRESTRLTRIVADLLDLSRLEAGGEPSELVELNALVAEEVHRFEDRAREAELDLDVRAEQVPALRGSARDLALLVTNLIDNAIRYTPAGGSVNVRVAGSDGKVHLRVVDSGIGIPRRDLERVLERFYRVDRGRGRRTGGTGLGLSIVRHVAENHGGSVSLTSEVGRGTTVEVVLPVDGPS